MSTQKKTNWWQLKNDKNFFYLLPSSFKLIGVILSILSFITTLIINNIGFEFLRMALINELLYSAVLVGLTMVSFSKEKDEDERIASLRFRSFGFAAGMMVLLFVFMPLVELLSDLVFTDLDYEIGYYNSFYKYVIITVVLLIQLLYFYKFKKEL